jgi:hypothetical protein
MIVCGKRTIDAFFAHNHGADGPGGGEQGEMSGLSRPGDDSPSNTTAGTELDIYPCNGTSAQQTYLPAAGFPGDPWTTQELPW